ncbi:MAG: hypothetical protein ACYS76_10945 [Planctomycetota bacterium]
MKDRFQGGFGVVGGGGGFGPAGRSVFWEEGCSVGFIHGGFE